MSWPAVIGFKRKDETVIGILSENDGTPLETGLLLLYFYDTPEKIMKLMETKGIEYLDFSVPTEEFLKKIEHQVQSGEKDFYYGTPPWENKKDRPLYNYEYYRMCSELESISPLVIHETAFNILGKFYKHDINFYQSMEDMLNAPYESFYLFDEEINEWLIGTACRGKQTHFFKGDHLTEFIPLQQLFDTSYRNFEIPSKKDLIQHRNNWVQEEHKKIRENELKHPNKCTKNPFMLYGFDF